MISAEQARQLQVNQLEYLLDEVQTEIIKANKKGLSYTELDMEEKKICVEQSTIDEAIETLKQLGYQAHHSKGVEYEPCGPLRWNTLRIRW